MTQSVHATTRKRPNPSARGVVRRVLTCLFALFLLPLATHAAWWGSQNTAWSWRSANWSSSGILPAPNAGSQAVVHVLAGRTGGWKGAFAHHTWIVLKPAGGVRYTRYDVVGWGRPVRIDNWAPDGRWYSNTPAILLTLNGEEATRAISRIERAVAAYPFSAAGSYRVWPGPNSNTFIGHVAREVPELAPGLLPTAIGKDFTPDLLFAGLAPSATGVQVSIRGLLGLTIAWVEGFELSFMGAVVGIDVRRPALKLPGWGRVGLP
jgi:Protein of unknown function (DUF3750)